jgi:hypothetical protein
MSNLDQRILDRLQELIQFGERVKQTKHSRSHGGMVVIGDAGINSELAHQWGMMLIEAEVFDDFLEQGEPRARLWLLSACSSRDWKRS